MCIDTSCSTDIMPTINTQFWCVRYLIATVNQTYLTHEDKRRDNIRRCREARLHNTNQNSPSGPSGTLSIFGHSLSKPHGVEGSVPSNGKHLQFSNTAGSRMTNTFQLKPQTAIGLPRKSRELQPAFSSRPRTSRSVRGVHSHERATSAQSARAASKPPIGEYRNTGTIMRTHSRKGSANPILNSSYGLMSSSREFDRRSHMVTEDVMHKYPTSRELLLREEDFWRRRFELDKQKELEAETRRQMFDKRDAAVEVNQSKVRIARDRQLHSAHMERERRLRQTKERRRQLQEEVEHYRQELHSYREQTLKRAREKASEKIIVDQQKMVFERRQREIQRQANAQDLAKAEDERRLQAEAALKAREERARQVLEEREMKVQESRGLALAAEQLREEIRRAYKLDSFDKVAQHAQLVNQLGLGNGI